MKKILVVDSSPTVRASVHATLRGAGFETIQAVDGSDGLNRLREANINGDQIGMIISDIHMMVREGSTFVQEVRTSPFRFIPVLGLMTESHQVETFDIEKTGVTGWIVKPFKPEQLVHVTKRFMR
jgi:two-component system, chemotaxis family, chemotaxis protein CheY